MENETEQREVVEELKRAYCLVGNVPYMSIKNEEKDIINKLCFDLRECYEKIESRIDLELESKEGE